MAHGLNAAKGWIFTENIIDSLLYAYAGSGVLTALGVTEKGAPDMSVDVAAGTYRTNGTKVTKGATTNVAITAAHATLYRKDIIVGDDGGTISVVDGTPMARQEAGETGPDTYQPTAPLIPANKILLAEIWVAPTVTEIYDVDIEELGVLVFDVDDSPVNAATEIAISSNWAFDHQVIGRHSEILLTPKASSTGAEGTLFYDSDDDHVYVATE